MKNEICQFVIDVRRRRMDPRILKIIEENDSVTILELDLSCRVGRPIPSSMNT